MNFSLFDLLVVIGISQGLFTGSLLFSVKQNRQRNTLLAFTLFTFILLSFKIILHTIGLWNIHAFRYFPLAFDLTIQPLIYLYIRSSVDGKFRMGARQALHFVPSLVFFIHAVIVYMLTQTGTNPVEQDVIASAMYFSEVKWFEDILSVISSWTYCYLSYNLIKNYRKWIDDNSGDMSYPTYTWLRNVLVLFTILVSVLTINLLLDQFGFGMTNFFHWQLFYLCMAVIIYYMGVQGYRQQSVPPPVVLAGQTKKEGPAIDERTVSSARQKIIDALENDKAYRDPEISIQLLASRIGVPTSIVSHTINNSLGKNFRNLVNEYRIAEVKQRLSDPRSSHLSLLGIALECGFNSEASFYRVFRQTTGMSPKEFVDRQASK
ncbi:MAG TPA: AraC family transcriptional regulator [Cyclobacteriaceae bacterium]|nr:AraC family transcriptional regulator [Cyclobacteriaceae bacterium]